MQSYSIQKFLEDKGIIPFKIIGKKRTNVKFSYPLSDEQKSVLQLGGDKFGLKETTTKQPYELKILLPKPHVNADV